MAPLGTGRFIITNSKYRNIVYLADDNSYSDLRGGWRKKRPSEMWNVELLSNGNYTIQNHEYNSYATCDNVVKPKVGDHIVAGDREQQWKITEVDGNSYVIFPTRNGQVCWRLVDEESNTPITLDQYCQTDEVQWKFSQVDAEGSGAQAVGEEDDADDEPKDNPFRGFIGSIVDLPLFNAMGLGYYTFSLAGTSQYLIPEGLSSKPPMANTRVILSNSMPYEKMWWILPNGGSPSFMFCDASGATTSPLLSLSIPEYGEGCLAEGWTELSLTPVGGPNEIRITDVKSGRCWDGFVIKYYGW